MKPNVGMRYPVASPITAYTPGTSITYDEGFVVSEARGATITWETEDGEFFGDDVRLDSMQGIIGGSIDFESTGLADAVRQKLLGEVKGSGDEYKITGANPPSVGFGYIKVMRDDTGGSMVTSYETVWIYKVQFAQPNDEAHTKEKNFEWRTPSMTGKISGVFLTSGSDDPDFCEHKTFATLALAKAYLNTKADIS